MVKCPNCGKDITEVERVAHYKETKVIENYKIENGKVTSKITIPEGDMLYEFYYCPLCRTEIGNEDLIDWIHNKKFDVYAFLEGK
jgi:hypothetical protein